MLRWLPAFIVLGLGSVRTHQPDAGRPVVVASKPFGESYILAEMFAQ
jgi:glycine betaine/choline ABC-type transport system substrate-binding protein